MAGGPYRILLIEDEDEARAEAAAALTSLGHSVVATDAGDAMAHLGAGSFDVVIAPRTPESPSEPREARLAVPPAVVYLPRPFRADDLAITLRGIGEREVIQAELVRARAALQGEIGAFAVGRSAAMSQVFATIDALAQSDASVLLTGESGTGKDVLARTIYRKSARATGPFVAVNCAAFPETLLEAELFGHERGAFTGALQRREGRFKAADGGTLFLDEINGLSLASQAKLLRVLQDGSFQPIGTNTTQSVDVRLISATNRDLRALVTDGKFREDLYYRIKVLDVYVPPLRERREDLPLLVQHFLEKHGPRGGPRVEVSPAAWAALMHHDFPGNVRELEHAIQHALVLSRGGEIQLSHLPRDLQPAAGEHGAHPSLAGLKPLGAAIREFEHAYLLRALEAAGGNRTRAAGLLGISRKTLWQKLHNASTGASEEEPVGHGSTRGYEH